MFTKIGVIVGYLLLFSGSVFAKGEKNVCYTMYGDEVACSTTGDTFASAVYRDNFDGTVTDLRSSLDWQQGDDGKRRVFDEAVKYCRDILLGADKGWRLPTRQELEAIADFDRTENSINPVFSCTPGNYWTATRVGRDKESAWTVGFYGGGGRVHSIKEKNIVRCVCGKE